MTDIHDLKCKSQWFNLAYFEEKTFELRKNDRDFKVGDEMILREIHNFDTLYTGQFIRAEITHVFGNNAQNFIDLQDYVILSFKIIEKGYDIARGYSHP